MKIWTNVCSVDRKYYPIETEVVNSYSKKERACAEMAELIARRIEDRSEFAHAMWYDENHEDFRTFVHECVATNESDGSWDYFYKSDFCKTDDNPFKMPLDVRKAVIDYVLNEINATGCYYVCCVDGDVYHFDVFENFLEETT